MKYLFDTATCIDILRNVPEVLARLAKVIPEDCAVSTVTSYELLCGVRKCRYPQKEATKVTALISAVHELAFDHEAALRAAQVRAELEAKGRPVGPYDTLLAGHALAAGLTLVTSNATEFERVPGLQWENWRS